MNSPKRPLIPGEAASRMEPYKVKHSFVRVGIS